MGQAVTGEALFALAAVLLVTLAFGIWRSNRQGRVRAAARRADAERLTVADLGADLGRDATFVQFSSAFCQPCRATRVLLQSVLDERPGVAHIEIDAESRLDLVRRLEVMRTPTVLVLDGSGAIRGRASGVPRRDQVLATLDSLDGRARG